jgi:predicted site-specific integrase-resolvase
VLEDKLSANTKALEEANTKCAEEVAAAQAVKEAEERAFKAEKALVEVTQRQSKREEAIVKHIDALLTSFSSKCYLVFHSACLILPTCLLTIIIP